MNPKTVCTSFVIDLGSREDRKNSTWWENQKSLTSTKKTSAVHHHPSHHTVFFTDQQFSSCIDTVLSKKAPRSSHNIISSKPLYPKDKVLTRVEDQFCIYRVKRCCILSQQLYKNEVFQGHAIFELAVVVVERHRCVYPYQCA